jgi:GNAT superfamily N-acetyltransferase
MGKVFIDCYFNVKYSFAVNIVIKQVDFFTVYEIWVNHLWPNRHSIIEPTSSMKFLGGYDLKNMNYNPTFFAYYINDDIAGVNSGHMCLNNQYRSRGLYVFPEHRKKGIGTELLLYTIEQAKKENAEMTWSYPRLQSWTTYKNAGFTLASDWEESELGLNAYCMRKL